MTVTSITLRVRLGQSVIFTSVGERICPAITTPRLGRRHTIFSWMGYRVISTATAKWIPGTMSPGVRIQEIVRCQTTMVLRCRPLAITFGVHRLELRGAVAGRWMAEPFRNRARSVWLRLDWSWFWRDACGRGREAELNRKRLCCAFRVAIE